MELVERTLTPPRALLLALLALLLLAPAADAASRDAAVAQYESALADGQVAAGWTGSTDTCTVGEESQASLDATRDALNVLRGFAGLEPVTFSAEKNHRALTAALMVAAHGSLDGDPHHPPESWECWTPEGYSGASTSNLFLGRSGAGAMIGYVEDGGVDSLGHRRWALDPEAMEMGSGSTGGTNALVVIGSGGDGSRAAALPADKLVAWPAPGLFPAPWIFDDWSVAIGNAQTQGSISLAAAQVSVKVDGKAAAVSAIRDLGTGYGTGATLTWRVALPASVHAGDHEIEIDVTGVTLNGAPFPVHYTVQAFDPGSNGAAESAACEKATAKLAKAKKKLRKAKRDGTPAQIQQAKKRVKKAKARKRDACA